MIVFWGIYSQKNILIKKKLYYFVKFSIKNFPQICHLQIFPNPFTSPFIASKQWLHGYYTTFEGPNVNEIIFYFGIS